MKKLLLSSVAALSLAGIFVQTASALEVTHSHGSQVDTYNFETEEEARDFAANLGLTLTKDANGAFIFAAAPAVAAEPVENFTIKVFVDGALAQEATFAVTHSDFLTHFAALKEVQVAAGYTSVEDKFDGNTVSLYFTAPTTTTVEKVKYVLNFETKDTKGTTAYEAASASEAELYFRNYVNENGLGDLEWSFDAKTNTFKAVVKKVETTKDELPTERNLALLTLDESPLSDDLKSELALEIAGANTIEELKAAIAKFEAALENDLADKRNKALVELDGSKLTDAQKSEFAVAIAHANTYAELDEAVKAFRDALAKVETTTAAPAKKEEAKKDAKATLPNTGETTTIAGLALATLSVVAGAFLVAPRFKKEN